MFRTDVLMTEPLGLLSSVVEDALALLAQGDFHGSGDTLANGNARFDLLPNGFDRAMRAQEAIGERFIFAHQAEQQMLGFDVRASVLTGFVARKKDYAASLFGIAFKHVSSFLPRLPVKGPVDNSRQGGACHAPTVERGHSAWPEQDYE